MFQEDTIIEREVKDQLCTAVKDGNLEAVKLIISSFDSEFFKTWFEGCSVICLAVEKEDEAVIQILLEAGANVDLKASSKQEFPLHCAIEKGNVKIVNMLIKYGARLDSSCSEGLTPFFHAVKKSNIKILKLILRAGAAFETKTAKGLPLLHFAFTEKSSLKMIRFLLRCGADIDAKNEDGLTPLHLVADKTISCDSDPEIDDLSYLERDNVQNINEIKLLLEFGASVNAESEARKEAILSCAAQHAKDYTVEMLLELGANINAINRIGYTPVLCASERLLMLDELCLVCNRYTYRDMFLDNWEINYNKYLNDDTDERCSSCNRSFELLSEAILYNNADSLLYTERKPEALINVVASITKEIVRLQVAGEDINKENLDFIRSTSMEPFVKDCHTEIARMKSSEITKNITYFDILVGSEENLSIYSNNKMVLERAKFENYSTEFPRYSKVLRARIMKGKERSVMLQKSMELFEEALDMKLPLLVLCEIFKYLKREDLIKFEIACKPVNLDSTDDDFLLKIGHGEEFA